MSFKYSAVNYLINSAKKFPDRTAIEEEDKRITFSELNSASKRLAAGILLNQSNKIPVCVFMPKSIEALVCFFGILYSKNIYVPIDYNDAVSRAEMVIENVDSNIIITDKAGKERLSGINRKVLIYDELIQAEVLEEFINRGTVFDTQPVYIMHTSGSTGVPKGVVVPHRGVIDFSDWICDYYNLDENSVIGLQSPLHFDASVFDIYACIKCGAKLVIIPENILKFPTYIPPYLEDKKVTCIFWVPSLMIAVANSGILEEHNMPDLKLVTFVGEVMPVKQLNIWRKNLKNRRFINLYGPTEASVACTAYEIKREFSDNEILPIGTASENKRILILNDENNQANINEYGEICILGTGLAQGYWNDFEKTNSVFVKNPLNKLYNEIIYKTGDIGYINEKNEIMYVGRKDFQVKIKGVRIELGDIENAARNVDGVQSACAVFIYESQKLILFIQSENEYNLRKFNLEIKKHIPAYMLPHELITLKEFPLNKNGKIDRNKLIKLI